METKIGTYHLTETKTFTKYGEFAGHTVETRVEPGDYDVMHVVHYRFGYRSEYVSIALPGINVCDAWCGTNTRIDREPRPAVHHLQPYSYEVAAWARKGLVTLEAGYGVHDFVGHSGMACVELTKDGVRF